MSGFIYRGVRSIRRKRVDDVVILSALRTPITRAKKGGLCNTYDHELLVTVLKAIREAHPNLDPAKLDDVQIGTVLSELGGSKAGRMAMLHAGWPNTSSFQTVNRACSSGLAAITGIAHAIALQQIDMGIGGGMESMTRNYGSRAIPTELWSGLKDSPVKDARDCVMSMGITAENIATRHDISREEQDHFAADSHNKAAAAREAGAFKSEIIPVLTKLVPDPSMPENQESVWVSSDDGIRPGSEAVKLATMKPAFKAYYGTVTAGNSSQVSDGAAATLMMRRCKAEELGLASSIMGKWAGTQVAGCAPDEMGIGPTIAIPKLLEYTGIGIEDVDVWEINEAFASQAIHCIRELGIDPRLVNPKGGAIALGHPLGATGARQLATLLPELRRRDREFGVISMCVGTGMGMASLFVRE